MREEADTHCAGWATAGECERNEGFMLKECSVECAAAEVRHACGARACDGMNSACELHDGPFYPAAGVWEPVNVTFRAC